jgi:hypothetical protein
VSTEALAAPPPLDQAGRLPALVRWVSRRRWPLLAMAGLIVVGMLCSTWGAVLVGRPDWGLPDDLWRTLAAAQRLLHLDIGGLYTPPTKLISFPGAAVILVPVAAVADAAGLSLQLAGPQNPHPPVWLLAGPYEIAIASLALLAADALAEHLGATQLKRVLLATAGAVALWGLTLRFGHPEDAVATGLFLFGILALAQSRIRRSGWLIGAAVAVQPLVLLALPFVLVTVGPRRWPRLLVRAAAPGALLLGIAAAANWPATVTAVTSQPNSPAVNRPTPWTSLIAHGSGGMVAAGPARALAVLVACGCALLAGRRWRAAARTGEWSTGRLTELLWWVAVALALRCVFEPVMVAYYLWPALAVALIAASRSWPRLLAVSAASAALTFGAQAPWRDPWTWWLPVTAGLALTLWLAHIPRTSDAGRSVRCVPAG